MARIRDLHIQRTASGRRRLRFTTWITNVGAGPFEVRATRASRAQARMTVVQRIYRAGGGYRSVRTPTVMRYAGDGHDHWHIQRIAVYELWSPARPATVLRGAKVGFCFFDTNRYRPGLRGAPRSRIYSERSCGVRASLAAHMGLSRGWADSYPWNFAWQWIDITGLRQGVYMLRVTVDKANWFTESSDWNNCSWSRIRIGAGSSVPVLATGTSGCPRPPTATPPPSPSPSPSPSASPSASPSPSVSPAANVPERWSAAAVAGPAA